MSTTGTAAAVRIAAAVATAAVALSGAVSHAHGSAARPATATASPVRTSAPGYTGTAGKVTSDPGSWLPAWLDGAHCTKGEARSFHVTRANCVNLVGTRQTITLTRSGSIKVHYS